MRLTRTHLIIPLVAVGLLTFEGCGSSTNSLPPKSPRPVTAMRLEQSAPPQSFVVSGVVSSWKTEEIGFEVGGRVEWVLEPGKYVGAPITAQDGTEINAGLALAQLDPASYEVAKEREQAALDVAKLNLEAAEIQLNQTIKADKASTQSDFELAETELNRMKQLEAQRAISAAELESAQNRFDIQQARLRAIEAQEGQAKVEKATAEANVRSAEQRLKDAKRNLRNTQLFASYRGQISEVHVVPGSVVSAGSPVLTLQMMDPIKIEFEVSAEQSRQIQRRLQVPVSFLKPDGSRGVENAIVHVVDPSADPSTRTFTVTLLMLNQQYVPESVNSGGAVARTEDIWPIDLNSVVGTPAGTKLFEENSIHEDENGKFVWVLDKTRRKQTLPEKLHVSKAYVNVSDAAIPFLGNWKFTIGTFVEPLPEEDLRLVTGKLNLPEDPSTWDGKSAVFDSGSQWMLRPGDLVSMDLDTGKKQSGWFVPIQAIYEESGYKYLFVVRDGKAKRMEVMAELPDKLDLESVVEIKPLEGQNFGPDMEIVVGGVHFLKDGDAIRVTEKLPGVNEEFGPASASTSVEADKTNTPEKAQ